LPRSPLLTGFGGYCSKFILITLVVYRN